MKDDERFEWNWVAYGTLHIAWFPGCCVRTLVWGHRRGQPRAFVKSGVVTSQLLERGIVCCVAGPTRVITTVDVGMAGGTHPKHGPSKMIVTMVGLKQLTRADRAP